MFANLIEKINKIIVKVSEMKNQFREKDDIIKDMEIEMDELEAVIVEKDNEISELKEHSEVVNDEMLVLMEEVEALKENVVDRESLAELEFLIDRLEEMLGE